MEDKAAQKVRYSETTATPWQLKKRKGLL